MSAIKGAELHTDYIGCKVKAVLSCLENVEINCNENR